MQLEFHQGGEVCLTFLHVPLFTQNYVKNASPPKKCVWFALLGTWPKITMLRFHQGVGVCLM